jgi:hypothetical protein
MPSPQSNVNLNALTTREKQLLKSLSTPWKIQDFLNSLPYNTEPNGDTCRSPRRVMRDKTAHCFEAALFAAAALRINGWPPLILDLVAVRDSDHVIAVYKMNGYWGAIAESNYSGLRFREPIYRTIRELAISYFEDYFNLKGEKTLRQYSRPVNLSRFDSMGWMTAEEDVWAVAEYLVDIPHTAMFRSNRRMYVDKRLFDAGMVGHRHKM